MSTNISKQRREDLIKKIKSIRTYISRAEQDENTANLLTYLAELEKEVRGKKYGLVFEEHRESIDEILEKHTPILTEVKELFINRGNQMNFLIEGDNLAALQLLQKTHKEKIDLIYIDPPYNTGNKDFIYNDKRVDSTDGFIHSKWISFMKNRLFEAQKLLSKKGLIFISIDDHEQANLKLLCNEIFGENNFRGQITRATGTPTGQGNETLVNEADYILIYSKSKTAVIRGLPFTEENSKIYNQEDKHGKYLTRPLRKTGGEDRKEDRPSMYYPVISPDGEEIFPIAPSGYDSRWRCAEKRYKELLESNMIEWKMTKDGWKVYQKFYLEGRTKQAGNLWIDVDGNKKATITVKNILGANIFDFPKPVDLIKRIIQIGAEDNSIILDFFAGSGTTAQAVMELNNGDFGKRKFILVQYPEKCEEETTAFKNGYKTIPQITYQRCKKVIEKEGYNESLKYYKVDYIPISEQLYYEYADELLGHIKELVELENGINFTNNEKIAIILTEEEMEDFINDTERFKKCRKIYLGHDVLLDIEQEAILKKRHIKVNIIPDYYYREMEG